MDFLIDHKNKTIFIHIPRTGGTSIESAFFDKDWEHIEKFTKHLHWKTAKVIYYPFWDDYTKFTVVRNPWDWIVSLFYSHKKFRAKRKTWEEFVEGPNLIELLHDLELHRDIEQKEIENKYRGKLNRHLSKRKGDRK